MGYWDNITDEVAQILAFAQLETENFKVNEVNNIILFIGLLRLTDSDAAKLLHTYNLHIENTREVAARYFRGVEEPGLIDRLKQAIITLTSMGFGIPIAPEVNHTLEIANQLAQSTGINVLPEHLILSLLQQKEPEVMALFKRMSVDTQKLKTQVKETIERKTQF